MVEFLNDTHMLWDWRIAIDQFLGCLGAGAFLAILMIGKYKNTAKSSAMLVPIAVIIGLIFLMSELGRPFNTWRVLIGSPTSIFFWGAFIQALFIVVSFLYAQNINVSGKEGTVKNLAMAGGILAVLVAIYHGLFQSVVIARPVWNNALVPILSLTSGLTAGIAVVMYLAGRAKEETEGVLSTLSTPFKILLGLQLVMLLVLALMNIYSSADVSAGSMILTHSAIFWVGALIVGVILPLLLSGGTVASLQSKTIAIAILVLLGAFAYRFVLLQAGVTSVVFNLPMGF